MVHPRLHNHLVFDELDISALEAALDNGCVLAEIYTGGEFNEQGFILLGRLEILETAGCLRFVGLTGAPDRAAGDARYAYMLTEKGRVAARQACSKLARVA